MGRIKGVDCELDAQAGNAGSIAIDSLEPLEYSRLVDPVPELLVEYDGTASGTGKLPTRVLEDTFHAIDRVLSALSNRHAGRYDGSSAAISHAFFIYDAADRAEVIAYLASLPLSDGGGTTWDQALRQRDDWVKQHCRRWIPDPDILVNSLTTLHESWREFLDDDSNFTLFNISSDNVMSALLEHARRGFFSDPPDIPL